jgi:nitrogen fixation NifU-like protein
MTEHVRGRTSAEARALADQMDRLCAGPTDGEAELGELGVFAGVRRYPARVSCATLPWHALRRALAD